MDYDCDSGDDACQYWLDCHWVPTARRSQDVRRELEDYTRPFSRLELGLGDLVV